MNRGNVDKVMADAAKIVQRLKNGEGQTALQKEYHVAYPTIKQVILSQITKAQWRKITRLSLQKGGVKTRFKKGHKTFNKGMKGIHLSPATEFCKGHLPVNHKHVGSIRISIRTRNGNTVSFKEIKVSGIMQGSHKWIPYARYIWEQSNGEVPEGHFIVHADGITLNDEPYNLECVNRRGHLALQMKRDPKMLKKCRKAAGKAAKKRHARNRILKKKEQTATEKKKVITKRRVEQESQQEKLIDSGVTDLRGALVAWWECTGCGFESKAIRPPLPCPKCNGLNYELIQNRIAKAS